MINHLLFIWTLLLPFSSVAQTSGAKNVTLTLPTITLLDVEPTGLINMNFTAPTEAGRSLVNPPPNTSKWINYTSAIAAGGNNRIITASINQTIPGIDIKLTAASASGGAGALGTTVGQVVLTTVAKTIISGIGGAYTGNGTSLGHQLTITATPNNYASLSSSNSTSIIIRYTISE